METAMTEVTQADRRPVAIYLYRPNDHKPLDAEGRRWLADQLCSETRVHPDRTMSIGWITSQAAYEYPALLDAEAAKDARIKELEAEEKALTHDLKRSMDTCNYYVNLCARLEAALRKIASCEKRADGDVVDVARAALKEIDNG